MAGDNLSLRGKTAIVTGSGRENGIGAGIAKALANHGANVAIHYASDASKTRAESVAESITDEHGGAQVAVICGAIDIPGTSDRLVKEAMAAFNVNCIDILVNNAGIASTSSLLEATPNQLQSEFAVNVFGAVYMIQSVAGVGKMPAGGRIVNIGTCYSKMGPPTGGSYAVSKAALDSITTSFAGELGKSRGITVNTLAPGPVPTDVSKPFLQNDDGSNSVTHDHLVGLTRAEYRMGTVDDIADATLLLVSEKSRWITAQFISVSGGINGAI